MHPLSLAGFPLAQAVPKNHAASASRGVSLSILPLADILICCSKEEKTNPWTIRHKQNQTTKALLPVGAGSSRKQPRDRGCELICFRSAQLMVMK
jgi:hypothetical protein